MKFVAPLILCLAACSETFGEKYNKLDALDSIVQFVKGQLKMVDLIINLDCVNAKYPYGGGGKVIHGCAAIGSPECVRKVVKIGGDVNFKDDRKKTALDYAQMGVTEKPDEYSKVLGLNYKGVVETIKELENGTDFVMSRDCYLNNAEWDKIMRESFKRYFDEAIDGGVNRQVIYPVHVGGGTFLHNCASANFYTCVQVMLENGADVNIKDDNGRTAFELAIREGYLEVAELIKNANASVNKANTLDETNDNEEIKAVEPEQHL